MKIFYNACVYMLFYKIIHFLDNHNISYKIIFQINIILYEIIKFNHLIMESQKSWR